MIDAIVTLRGYGALRLWSKPPIDALNSLPIAGARIDTPFADELLEHKHLARTGECSESRRRVGEPRPH